MKAVPKPKSGKSRSAKQGDGGVSPWLLGLGCGVLATMAAPVAAAVAGLLAPVIIILICDQRRGRPALRPVLLLGLAFGVQPLNELWQAGATMDAVMALLADAAPIGWIVQAAGWLTVELAPLLIRIAIDAGARARVARLQDARQRCLDQWDMEDAA